MTFRRRNGRWTVPVVSGALIAAALVTGRLLGLDAAGDALMTAAAAVAGLPVVARALRALTARVVGIDLLVGVAAVGAVLIGEYWEAAAVTFLFAVGHALEAATLDRTRSALAELVALAPDTAVVLRDGTPTEVPAARVRNGETVLVTDGAKIPVDGEVAAGTGAVDEAAVTGESIPAEKGEGDRVFAGTVSRGGFLRVVATGVGADTTLARIVHRVEEAQDARARTQRFMDRFSAWYTPAAVVAALVVGLFTADVALALTLLVISCPGALVISIPVSVVAGVGRAARDGILVKGGEFLERTARVSAVALDKTGTLTRGRPRLTDVVVLDPALDRNRLLSWAARAEAGSGHPLARPVLEAAAAEGLPAPGLPEHVEPVAGRGVSAVVDGHRVLVGNRALLERYGAVDTVGAVQEAERFAAAGRTPMVVAVDGAAVGVVAVADEVREDAAATVAELRRAGVARVVMLTGDAAPVAAAVAAATGIEEVHAGLLPEQKLDVVAELRSRGHTVAMVGDGVNDAPALAAADIGVAMGAAGSAVAVETADIALMGDRLHRLPEALRLARRTVAVLRQNIAIAVATVVLLALGVLLGGVTMAAGMLVHEVSVLAVTVNAMRLLRRERHRSASPTEGSGTGRTPRTGPVGEPGASDAPGTGTPGASAR